MANTYTNAEVHGYITLLLLFERLRSNFIIQKLQEVPRKPSIGNPPPPSTNTRTERDIININPVTPRDKAKAEAVKTRRELREKLRRALLAHPEITVGKDVNVILRDIDLSIEILQELIEEGAKQLEAAKPKIPNIERDLPIDFIDIDESDISTRDEQFITGGFEATPAGETRLGDIVLSIPPEQISIIDTNAINAIPIVRGMGSIKMRSGQGQLRLEMTIEIKSIEDFNNQIRPLVAQIRRTPWFPVDNWHIKRIFLPVDPFVEPNIESDLGVPPETTNIANIINIDPVTGSNVGGILKGNINTDPVTGANVGGTAAALKANAKIPLDPDAPSETSSREAQEITTKKAPFDPVDEPLFMVVHDISIATNPGNPGYFYVALVASVFNHTPFLSEIRYLVDDSDVVSTINATLEVKKAAKYTVDIRNQSGRAAIGTNRYKVHTTRDIRKSKVYKKWYQGLLEEYRGIEGATAPPGAPPKIYTGAPYDTGGVLSMGRLTADQAQDVLLRGWVDKRTFMDIFNERLGEIEKVRAQLDAFHTYGPKPRGANLLKLGWEAVVDVLYMLSSAYTDVHSLLTKFDDPKIEAGTIFVRNPHTQAFMPIDNYLDDVSEDDKSEKIIETMEAMIAYKYQKGRMALLRPLTAFDVLIRNDNRTTITGMTTSMSTNVVPLTLTGQIYPTYQHLGVGEFSTTMNIQTTDYELIRKIRFLNLLLNRTHVRHQGDLREQKDIALARKFFFRDFSIEILSAEADRTNLMQSLGIRKVVIPQVTYSTVKGQPGLFSITMQLAQNDLDIIQQENIFSTTGIGEDVVEDVARHLMETNINDLNDPWAGLAQKFQQWKEFMIEQDAALNESVIKVDGGMTLPYDQTPIGQFLKGTSKFLRGAVQPSPAVGVGTAALLGGSLVVGAFTGPLLPILAAIGSITALGVSWLFNNIAGSVEAYALSGELRGYLSRLELIPLLDRPDILKKISDAISDDSNFYNSCYPDLQLPPFVPPEVGNQNSSINTPADFYVARREIIDGNILDLALREHQTMGNFVDTVASMNEINTYGQATRPIDPKLEREHQLRRQLIELQVIEGLLVKVDAQIADLKKFAVANGRTVAGSWYLAELRNMEDQKEQLTRRIKSRTYPQGKSRIVLDTDHLARIEETEAQMYTWGATAFEWQETADKVLSKTLNDILRTKVDDVTLSMARAHPTFKVFFIEEDDERFLSFNDVYGYNAIQSIDVVASRKSASRTAVIRMSNLTGILTDPLSQLDTEATTTPASLVKSAANIVGDQLLQDTTSEQIVKGLMIREGMRIIVRMGYSNNPNDLHTVFDGGVVSVSPGDQIEIVAQSWAAEMNNLIGMEGKDGERISYGLDELGRDTLSKLFQFSHPAARNLGWTQDVGFADVARRIFQKVGDLSRFGRRSFFKHPVDFQPITNSDRVSSDILQSLAGIGTLGATQMNKKLVSRIFNYFKNPKDDNIWINWDRALPWYAGQNREVGHHFFNWFIYKQTGFDAMQELLIFFPDHVFMELPYNESNLKMQRPTLYVGPRDGLYLAEDIDPVTNPELAANAEKWIKWKSQDLARQQMGGRSGLPTIPPPKTSYPSQQGQVYIPGFEKTKLDERFRSDTPDQTDFNHGDSGTVFQDDDLILMPFIQDDPLFDEDNIGYPSVFPVDGPRDIRSHFTRNIRQDVDTGRTHDGVDLAVPIGTAVKSSIYGTTSWHIDQSKNGGFGIYMKVTSLDQKVVTIYGHLSERIIPNNTTVMPGDVIALSGNSGHSTGPHLHYGVLINGVPMDPIKEIHDNKQLQGGVGAAIQNRGKRGFSVDPQKIKSEAKSLEIDGITKQLPKRQYDAIPGYESMLRGESREFRPKNPDDLWGRPGFKRVTRSHFLDSYHHILDNQIKASSQNMWNRVILEYPGLGPTPFREFEFGPIRRLEEENQGAFRGQTSAFLGAENPANLGDLLFGGPHQLQDINQFDLWLDEGMDSGSVRALHTFQKNIDPLPWETLHSIKNSSDPLALPIYYRVANSILANGMREMYTGSLTVLLDPTIGPWDRIYLYDYANEMFGAMGVEEVHHHIDLETGATTTIVPDLIVEQQNMPAILGDNWYHGLYGVGVAGSLLAVGTGAMLGAQAAGPVGAAIGGAVGLVSAEKLTRSIWFKLGGRLLGREAALAFTGLWHRGVPYVAGMEGVRRETTFTVIQNAILSVADIGHTLSPHGDMQEAVDVGIN